MQENVFFYETPVGKLGIVENGLAITGIYYEKEGIQMDTRVVETDLLKKTGRQLKEFFEGDRKTFDLPLAPKGTPFQLRVWKALLDIPYGETRSYKDIASAAGNIKACRAVGMANNCNPIAIVIPCHRVIGSNGDLVGYGMGLHIKRYLLDLEKRNMF